MSAFYDVRQNAEKSSYFLRLMPRVCHFDQEEMSTWPCLLAILACLLVLSGIDDFVPVLICISHWLHRMCHRNPQNGENTECPERRIAIFVPCWKESEVIEGMVRNNLARIRYHNFDFFLGVYPNDQATSDVSARVAACFPNVHVAMCPNAGPTSKADCLNAIYDGMREFEEKSGAHFDTIILHDAEDVIHADALAVINRKRANYEMVQVPVLPLDTRPTEITHGIYCDEFAEFQLIDMRARQYSGSFIPSSGVGTGFARDVLERLAADRHGTVFDASSLTEDYEIGVQIHLAGFKQIFSPLARGPRGFITTREFFPRKLRSAIRQRKRWITGIALQSWQRNGWRGSLRTRYWFWRDRKGLLTNPLGLITNLVSVAGALDWLLSRWFHRPWSFAIANPAIVKLCFVTAGVQVFRTALRSVCVSRIFGFSMGVTVVLRFFYANFVNCAATLGAVGSYAHSRLLRKALRWDKTDHAYPTRAAEDPHRLTLEEVLIRCGYVTQIKLELARESRPAGTELADYLVATRIVSEDNLCRAMSLQSGLPWSEIDVEHVNHEILRTLPARVERELKVLPFRVSAGRLHLAATRVPEAHVFDALSRFTQLPVQVELVTRRNYGLLRERLRTGVNLRIEDVQWSESDDTPF